MRFDVITLFPEMFAALTDQGITGRAVTAGLVQVQCWNPRDFTHDVHRTVDDRPYGGGPGMVMKVEPLRAAIQAARAVSSLPARVVYLSPQGSVLQQPRVREMAAARADERVILLCGRYEGIDERLIQREVDEEISIGDYVLSGGELPAMVLMDAVIRQLPGALGDERSAAQDSFFDGLLDCPHYTRPEQYEDLSVPAVLMSGHHEDIRRWRLQQSLQRTAQRRPELLAAMTLDAEQRKLLQEIRRASGEDVAGS